MSKQDKIELAALALDTSDAVQTKRELTRDEMDNITSILDDATQAGATRAEIDAARNNS